jgi:hypothetical protein
MSQRHTPLGLVRWLDGMAWFGLASSVPSSHRDDGVGEFRDMWGVSCGAWCCLHDDDAGGGARRHRLHLRA